MQFFPPLVRRSLFCRRLALLRLTYSLVCTLRHSIIGRFPCASRKSSTMSTRNGSTLVSFIQIESDDMVRRNIFFRPGCWQRVICIVFSSLSPQSGHLGLTDVFQQASCLFVPLNSDICFVSHSQYSFGKSLRAAH